MNALVGAVVVVGVNDAECVAQNVSSNPVGLFVNALAPKLAVYVAGVAPRGPTKGYSAVFGVIVAISELTVEEFL